MNDAIARIVDEDAEGKASYLGTAFAVSQELGLTAFHCVGDREKEQVRTHRVKLRFSTGSSVWAEYVDGDPRADFAVLRFSGEFPAGERPIPLVLHVAVHTPFRCGGYPLLEGPDISYSHGTVVAPETTIFDGVAALQLHSQESAARLPLAGMSGAPVLVGNPEAAIGLIRWNPVRKDAPELAVGGIVYACPVASAVKHFGELERCVQTFTSPDDIHAGALGLSFSRENRVFSIWATNRGTHIIREIEINAIPDSEDWREVTHGPLPDVEPSGAPKVHLTHPILGGWFHATIDQLSPNRGFMVLQFQVKRNDYTVMDFDVFWNDHEGRQRKSHLVVDVASQQGDVKLRPRK